METNEWGEEERSQHAVGILGASPQVREAEVERARGACGIPATWTRKEAESSPARRPFPGGALLRLPPTPYPSA